MKKSTIARALAALCLAGSSAPALATNGMNMEGYGPIATGMGGASMAYDNGTAGVINNPATLGLMGEGSRVDLALGFLGPNVSSSAMGMRSDSRGDAYYMPAFGFVAKRGALSYGVGVFAQGGMGTEYGTSSILNGYRSAMGGMGMNGVPVAMGGDGLPANENRSEVGVGALIFPVAFNVSPNLTIGGALDYKWAGMDVMMQLPGSTMAGMMQPGGSGVGSISGGMVNGFGLAMMPGSGGPGVAMLSDLNWGQFKFSNHNDYTGRANATGWGGRFGLVYKASPELSFGASYHLQSQIADLEGRADLAMNVNMMNNAMTHVPVNISGRIAVHDFQWPSMFGVGAAYQAGGQWLVAADYRRINWSEVMDKFRMTFTADAQQSDPAAQGILQFMAANGITSGDLSAVLNQNWKNQNVFQVGVSYRASDALTLRAGFNTANNPVPNDTVNALFPATVKTHYTLGLGYAFSKASELNFSATFARKNTVENAGAGMSISHSQFNWQLMYTHRL
ncbi:MAG: aromatic hydrocarbon degradation protein [Burkholderiales bacterium]|nr:MAG: aromatic hydrocarbon degradation protein [Burkholderiales bacterium]